MSQAQRGLFAEKLPHAFDFVNKQIAAGLFSTKRFHKCLREISAAPHGVAEISAAMKSRADKLDVYRNANVDDMQSQYRFASNAIVSNIGESINNAVFTFLTKLETEIAGDLKNYCDHNEKVRLTLNEKAKRTEDAIKNLRIRVVKQRKDCRKLHARLLVQKMQREKVPAMIDGKANKKHAEITKSYLRVKSKAIKAFEEYEEMIKELNSTQNNFHTKELPLLMSELEAMERGRLSLIAEKTKKFMELQKKMIEELTDISSTMTLIPQSLNEDNSITDFTKNVIIQRGRKSPIPPLFYDLPATPTELDEDNLNPQDIIEEDNNNLKVKGPRRSRAMSRISGFIEDRSIVVPAKAAPVNPAPYEVIKMLEDKYKNLHSSHRGSARERRTEIMGRIREQGASFKMARRKTTYNNVSQIVDSAPESAGPSPGTVVVALHEFTSSDNDELSLTPGDMITITSTEGLWWTGTKNGTNQSGSFPSNYVRIRGEALMEEMVQVRSLFDYTPDPGDEDDYIALKAGDVFVGMPHTDDWWFGFHNERSGFFPANFITLVDEE